MGGLRVWRARGALATNVHGGAAWVERGGGDAVFEVPDEDCGKISDDLQELCMFGKHERVCLCRGETILLYPNLLVSELAPATAKCGDEKKVFAAWSMALRMLMRCKNKRTTRRKSQSLSINQLRWGVYFEWGVDGDLAS